jgi:hypothetical protein
VLRVSAASGERLSDCISVNGLVAPTVLVRTSTAEYVRLAREAFGAFNAMMAHLSPQEHDFVWSEVEGSMRGFESPAGFEVPGECLVGAARK